MPLYDFYCDECHSSFTIQATFQQKEAGLKPECPQCRGQQVRQVITAGLLLHSPNREQANHLTCGPNARSGCCG